jgi:hypothetical protein
MNSDVRSNATARRAKVSIGRVIADRGQMIGYSEIIPAICGSFAEKRRSLACLVALPLG